VAALLRSPTEPTHVSRECQSPPKVGLSTFSPHCYTVHMNSRAKGKRAELEAALLLTQMGLKRNTSAQRFARVFSAALGNKRRTTAISAKTTLGLATPTALTLTLSWLHSRTHHGRWTLMPNGKLRCRCQKMRVRANRRRCTHGMKPRCRGSRLRVCRDICPRARSDRY